jgi:uncharacterized membrane protein
MSPHSVTTRPRFVFGAASLLTVLAAAVAVAALTIAAAMLTGAWSPRAPDFGLLARASPAIKIHLAAAIVALAVGTILMIGRKGVTLHRLLGWTWAGLMMTAAGSSLFIRSLNHGGFSIIHMISGWTLIAVPLALMAARRHNVARHRRAMTSVYIGGLIVAGTLAFLPGRLMWQVFVG